MSGQPFYALIIPQSGPGVPTQPPGIWGPIYHPDQGLPGNQPYPGQGLPGNQPYPGQGLPGWQPGASHPIAPGGQPPRPWGPIYYPDQGLPQPPLGIWGGRPPNYVDIGGPGNQPYPGQGLPGNQPYPGQGLPMPPPGTWGGRPPLYVDIGGPGPQPIPGWGPGFPTNPIVIPPEDLPDGPVGDDKMVIVVFVPGVGYKMVVVPKPEMPPGYNPPTGPSTERPTPVDR